MPEKPRSQLRVRLLADLKARLEMQAVNEGMKLLVGLGIHTEKLQQQF